MLDRTDFEYDIFLSYRDDDEEDPEVRNWVRKWLLPKLEGIGLKVFDKSRDFEVGVAELVNAQRAVDRSAHVLLVVTPAWTACGLTLFEQVCAQHHDPTGVRKRTLPLLRQRCALPETLSKLTYADFTKPEDWDSQFRRLQKAVQGESVSLTSTAEDRGTIIPSIRHQSKFSAPTVEYLEALGYDGSWGRLIPGMQNLDVLEVRLVGAETCGSFIVLLNLRKDDKVYVFKLGWLTSTEVDDYCRFVPKAWRTDGTLQLLPPLLTTTEPDIGQLGITLSPPYRAQTLSEFLRTQCHVQREQSWERTLRSWVDRIFRDVEYLHTSIPTAMKQTSNYAQLYRPRLADFILHVSGVDPESHHLQVQESVLSFKFEQMTLARHGPYFTTWVPLDSTGNHAQNSAPAQCISLVPVNDQVAKRLLTITQLKQGVLLSSATGGERPQSRNGRLLTMFRNAFQTRNKEFREVEPNKPVWRHFGQVVDRKTLCGLAHGNLQAGNIIVIPPGEVQLANEETKLWIPDYRYLAACRSELLDRRD